LEPVTFAAQAEPPSVYADRGFGTRIGDDALDKHKIADAVIPAGPSLARRADAELATPLPLPQRPGRPDLAAQAEGACPHPPT
jgi:hypothetical protein